MANMRTIGVRLRLMVDSFRRDASEAGDAADKMGDRVERAGKKSKKSLDDFIEKSSVQLGVAGAALVGVAGAAVFAFAKFDKQMSEVGAVSNASAEELDKLSKAALAAGAATVFSASQAAEAEAELAKAGISTADILEGGLTGALDLAAAGSLDLAEAAGIAAAALNTFHLKGKDVGHIADVLAAAANKSSAGVEDLGQGLQQVGLIAAQVDFSLDETVALLAAFADRGLKGSDGATSLKTALLRLAAPTGEAKDLMKSLGISMYDAQGGLIGAADIAGQLQDALDDLSPAQRNATLNTIFGSDAIRAANILYSQGRDGIEDYVKAVNDQGAASRVAAAKLDNLSGDVEALKGSLETLFITAGSGSNNSLRFLTQTLTGITNLVGSLPAPLLSAATGIAGLSGAALLSAVAMVKVRKVMAEYRATTVSTSVAVRGATAAMSSMARVLGPVALGIGAFVVAVQGLDKADWLDWAYGVPVLKDIVRQVDGSSPKMHRLETATADAARAEQIMTGSLEAQFQAGLKLIDIWNELNGNMVSADKELLEASEAVDEVSKAFKENGKSIEGHSRAALRNRIAMEDAAQQAIEAADAYLRQTGDVAGAKKMLDDYKEATIKATGATGDAKTAVKKLADELFRLPASKDVSVNLRFGGASTKQIQEKLNSLVLRDGGIVQHAEQGLLSQAAVYNARHPALYAFAEPATGGEAFVPRQGNYSRSMGILQQAAGWYGASVVPNGYYPPSGGQAPVQVIVQPVASGGGKVERAIAESIRFDVRTQFGGDVQSYAGPRRR